jgi:Protein of unknown function (DUF3667)
MSSEIAAVCDTATGALIANTIEPETGQSAIAVEGDCLNCQSPISGAFCNKCGQKTHVHRTLRGFGHDILHGVLHFDGKIWRTIPMLILNPGHLTRRYIHGERARFVSPIALFLFCVFLTFAVFNRFVPQDVNLDAPTKAVSIAKERKDIAALQVKLRRAEVGNDATDWISDEIERHKERLSELEKDSGSVQVNTKTDFDPDFDNETLNEAIKKAGGNPQLLLYKVQSNAYKFSWALIPISIPFIWLLFFWRREFKMFDHAVFVTYSLCFIMILSSASVLLEWVPALEVPVILMMVLIPPLHVYRQIKQAYNTTRFGALWRTFATLWFALFAISLFAGLIVALGIAG